MLYEAFDCMLFPCPCSRLKIWSNLRDSSRVSRRRPFIYCERSEFVKAWLREKIVRKKTFVVSHRGAFTGQSYPLRLLLYIQSFPSILAPEILPASESVLRSRRSNGVRLAYTDPFGERQRAPSTPQQLGLPSLHRSFRRATASTVHAAWGPSSLQRSFRRAIASSGSHVFSGGGIFLLKQKRKQAGRMELASR